MRRWRRLIPFAFLAYVWDEEKQGFTWSLSPDFVALVQERFAPEDTMLVTCRSGGRGAMAMQHAGRPQASPRPTTSSTGWRASKVDDADSVFDGMRRKNGWLMSGLPWTYDLDPDVMALPEARGDRRASRRERRGLRGARGGGRHAPNKVLK